MAFLQFAQHRDKSCKLKVFLFVFNFARLPPPYLPLPITSGPGSSEETPPPLLPLTGLGLLYYTAPGSPDSWSSSPHSNLNPNCCLIEPVGTSAPRFSSNSESLGVFKSATGKSFNFVCPAQASPVPSHRLDTISQKPLGFFSMIYSQ